jgi:hypothetical protein
MSRIKIKAGSSKSVQRQSGAILLLLTMLLVLAATTFYIASSNSEGFQFQRDNKTAAALSAAKAALIGYAISYDDTHPPESYGYLPCPDLNPVSAGEGSQTTCGSAQVSTLGKFPWKTLDTETLRDGHGECLWYAVSGKYKNNPKFDGLNPTTLGQLVVKTWDGKILADPTDPAVAVIFAPGYPLNGQSREKVAGADVCGGNYTSSNYLDNDIFTSINNSVVSPDADAITTFAVAPESAKTESLEDSFNDRLVFITRREVFAAYCQKYVRKLTSIVNAGSGCGEGEDPVGVKPECEKPLDNLKNYCEPESCKEAAIKLLETECLEDISKPVCQDALDNLEDCYAG